MDRQYFHWLDSLQHLNENGATIFISGFLFTLSFYHFLLYFQHKDKFCLLYSLYTFLIFLYVYYKAKHFFLADVSNGLKPFYQFFTSAFQWSFNLVFIIFIQVFIDLKNQRPKWNQFLNNAIYFYSIALFGLLIHASITGQNNTLNTIYAYLFIPSISIIAIMTIVVVVYMKTYLKYYVLAGAISYIVFSIVSYYSSQHTLGSTSLFYMGLLLENIFFALGLGAKQNKIQNDKNKAQAAVLEEQKLHLKLKRVKKQKLDEEVAKKTEEIVQLTEQYKEDQKEKLKARFAKQTLDLRMKAFQTQMNPQFLFNSLNSLKHYIIKNDKRDAVLFLSKLSKLIRKILDNSQLKETSLLEELNVMKLYLEVENMRSEKSILLQINIQEGILTNAIKLPPLVLQPLIENAIWHGLSLIKEDKSIIIEVNKENSFLIISIEDNGIGRIRAAQLNDANFIEKESIGIDITIQRLQAFTSHLKKKASIHFEDLYKENQPIGTKVIVAIPLE